MTLSPMIGIIKLYAPHMESPGLDTIYARMQTRNPLHPEDSILAARWPIALRVWDDAV